MCCLRCVEGIQAGARALDRVKGYRAAGKLAARWLCRRRDLGQAWCSRLQGGEELPRERTGLSLPAQGEVARGVMVLSEVGGGHGCSGERWRRL